jgi:hypothetical protein
MADEAGQKNRQKLSLANSLQRKHTLNYFLSNTFGEVKNLTNLPGTKKVSIFEKKSAQTVIKTFYRRILHITQTFCSCQAFLESNVC